MIIGLTGSFGTGKSFAASVFKSLGAKVIDADLLARKAVKKGSGPYGKIVAVFGKGVLDKRGEIDRRKLGKMVFADKRKLAKLNSIVHPEVISNIKKEICRLGADNIVVIDAPLLIEARLLGLADTLVVVKASKSKQIERCMKKFRISKNDVLRRIGNQIPLTEKIEMADFVIDNNGTKSETRKQIMETWRKVWK